MTSTSLRLPDGYSTRQRTVPFIDVPAEIVYQPHVYELAAFFARRSGANTIIDIGCGSGTKLKNLQQEFQLVCIDCEPALKLARGQLVLAEFIEADLEAGLPSLDSEILCNSVVICSDVIEHLRDPERLARDLAPIARKCKFLLASTPDRTRARGLLDNGPPLNASHFMEWSADEFGRFLIDCGWPPGMLMGHTINTDKHHAKTTTLVIAGQEACRPSSPRRVTVSAIIHSFNERDIIGEIAEHLNLQGVEVHIIDNWSTDGTFEMARDMKGVTVSRFPDVPTMQYRWYEQLKHTAIYASQLNSEWVMHCDADEVRYSPWRNVRLADAIGKVDELGYNAIDFTVLDFRYLVGQPESRAPYENSLNYFEFGRRPGHFRQVKAWKNGEGIVDLANAGGHDVAFPSRRIFPLKFLSKHYPLRSPSQAHKKIFNDRLPRFSSEQKARGWHTQYESYREQGRVDGWSRHSLIPWHDALFENEYLVERLSGIGVAE